MVVCGIIGTAVLFGYGWVACESGRMAGEETAQKATYEKGFRDGEFHGAVVGPGKFSDLLRAKDEALRKATEKPKLVFTEYWEKVDFVGDKETKFFFYSKLASPPLIQTFEGAEEEAFHYVYCNDGVYAFPVAGWTFTEIYTVVQGGDKPPPEPRFFGGAEIRKTF
jgi:hypothetical protein